MVRTGVRRWAALLLVVAAAGLGCDDDEVPGPQVQLDIQNLQPLEAGRYELWIIEGGNAHLAGTVTPSASGEVDGALFDIPSAVTTPENAVITYENDSDTDPSDSKLMGGAFGGTGVATFSLVGFALESEAFSAANTNGEYFLRTPSDEAAGAPNNGNDEQGVWIGTPGMPPAPDLALPALQPGWVYEGWVVETSAGGPFPVTTGRFADDQGVNGTADRDSDEQGPFGGTENNGPPIPGNDYVMDNASEMLPAGLARPPFTLNDGNWMVVITLEPTDNDTPGPFSVKPLGAAVADGAATAPTTFDFGFDPLGSIPSGTASLVNGG
ncbi:MAG: hypothetical protein ACYS0D_07610 [Planctomycetota bacterium]|jgi:hypothetical protein